MKYDFLSLKVLRKDLCKYKSGDEVNRSGLPLMYEDDTLLYSDKDFHSLVIGCNGSGKTQSVLLPSARLAIKAGESLVCKDAVGDIYGELRESLEENDYKVYVLSYDDVKNSNFFNPLASANRLYKEGRIDEALLLLENMAYYIFDNSDNDSFWRNSAIQYFIGISLYLFRTNKKEITFDDIYNLTVLGSSKENYFQTILSSLDKTSTEYIYLSGVLDAPRETLAGIMSVFKVGLGAICSRRNLMDIFGSSDFSLDDIIDSKFAIFLVGDALPCINRLESMFINQLYYRVLNKKNKKRINVFLDDFENLYPFADFVNLLNSSRYLNFKLTVFVKSLKELERLYGKEDSEVIRYTFGAIVYLLANDMYTCNEISELCGKDDDNKLLIKPEELKLMKMFEAVVLMPRTLPIKTKLLPDYKMKW